MRAALVWTALSALLLGGVYPLVVTGVGRLAFAQKANGSLIERDGRVIGSELIGQTFTSDRYFHGRPSAAGYDAANSSGSNLGPTAKALAERVHASQAALQDSDGAPPPVELFTTSGSGLDPHLSPAAARYQIPRIARARGVSVAQLEALVARHTEGRTLGLLGEPRVNVLRLNLELDR